MHNNTIHDVLAIDSQPFAQRRLVSMCALYCLLALSYLLCIDWQRYPLDFAHKALPIALLLCFVWQHNAALRHWIAAALVFSGAGDILLALPITHSFSLGLGAFMIAQCCYAKQFFQWRRRGKPNLMAITALTLIFIVVAFIVIPKSGPLWPAVTVYMLAILSMAVAALVVEPPNHSITLGALFFVCSDGLIAVNKFVVPVPYESYWIMTTYYVAQLLLVVGCLHRKSYAKSS